MEVPHRLLEASPDGGPPRPLRIVGCGASAVVGATAVIASAVGSAPRPPEMFGFRHTSAVTQQALERQFAREVSRDRLEAVHRELTRLPHMAGSSRDHDLADWMADRWRAFGLDAVEVVEHDVLLPYAVDVSVEMTGPRLWRAAMRPAAAETGEDSPVGPAYHAYSRSGEINAPVVYAGRGQPADYDWLAEHDIAVAGRIVLVHQERADSYRGAKVLTAEERGAAGILIFQDPQPNDSSSGWAEPIDALTFASAPRGSVAYSFLAPGDPLTPGWASTPGAPRIDATAATALPRILSLPLSTADARVILDTLTGPEAPAHWQPGRATRSRVGPGPPVRMRVRLDERMRPVWTVIGRLDGTDTPHEVVIAGNHRDAWTFGGVDPSSGTACLMELARILGTLARQGVRPRRSLLLASWDAEEFALASSTEWGEQHEWWLRSNAVAYLNVDRGVSGRRFRATGVPSLSRLVTEVAGTIRDPTMRVPVPVAWREDRPTRPARGLGIVSDRIGGGSDYSVFLNRLGIPIVDMTFGGPYDAYHTEHDTHDWVSRVADPGFRYHQALVRLWGATALRLANADVLPLDYGTYAARVEDYLMERLYHWQNRRHRLSTAEGSPGAGRPTSVAGPPAPAGLFPSIDGAFLEAVAAAQRWARAGRQIERRAGDLLEEEPAGPERPSRPIDRLNASLRLTEQALLDPSGLPDRSWYRHLVYAPAYDYEAEVLPGIARAVAAGDPTLVESEVRKLEAALDRATRALLPSP